MSPQQKMSEIVKLIPARPSSTRKNASSTNCRGAGTQPQQRNENKKYDNSRLKKINQPVASAARFPSHPARPRLLCTFAASASRLSTRLRPQQLEHVPG